jgi:DNA-binding NarL/FixJ family response regulator
VDQPFEAPLTEAAHAAVTERQRRIIALVTEGLTNQAIADRLGVERLTVSEEIATILWQLGLRGRHEITASAAARRRGP